MTCRVLTILIVVGLVASTMPVHGANCRSHTGQPRPTACEKAGTAAEICCKSQGDRDTPGEETDTDCCTDECNCPCCGAAVQPVMARPIPSQVTIAPRAESVPLQTSVYMAQTTPGELLRPPQT